MPKPLTHKAAEGTDVPDELNFTRRLFGFQTSSLSRSSAFPPACRPVEPVSYRPAVLVLFRRERRRELLSSCMKTPSRDNIGDARSSSAPVSNSPPAKSWKMIWQQGKRASSSRVPSDRASTQSSCPHDAAKRRPWRRISGWVRDATRRLVRRIGKAGVHAPGWAFPIASILYALIAAAGYRAVFIEHSDSGTFPCAISSSVIPYASTESAHPASSALTAPSCTAQASCPAAIAGCWCHA